MAISTFLSDAYAVQNIGRVSTPVRWAEWCLEGAGIYDDWRSGATIIEPTCGAGAFFLALVNISKRRRDTLDYDLCCNLYGIEINLDDRDRFFLAFQNATGFSFPKGNFLSQDFLFFQTTKKFDIAMGNPPWANFTDLPSQYKERTKSLFEKYGLVRSRRNVLLGASRIDFSALVLVKCMIDHVKPEGKGYFFVPMSLFFNDTANSEFRPRSLQKNAFSVERLIEIEGKDAFPNVATRNGLVYLAKSRTQKPIVPYQKVSKGLRTDDLWCHVTDDKTPWTVSELETPPKLKDKVQVARWQQPRQGINSCGLNRAFILEGVPMERLGRTAMFRNGFGEEVMMSTRFLFPLASGETFGRMKPRKPKYILCLYNSDCRPLDWETIQQQTGITEYLERYRNLMLNRKGVRIQNLMRKGAYWALMGVGPYTFTGWKVLWESMGKREFKAVVVPGQLQGNQALHAYIPSTSLEDAQRIASALNAVLPDYLRGFGMEGTCNWAQPGRVKRVLALGDDGRQPTLFD